MNEMFIFELEPFRVRRQRRRASRGLSLETEAGGAAPPPAGGRTSRPYVAWVQNTLNRVLGPRLVVDGIMGPATRSAIRTFQQREELQVDGIVGPLTERRLIAATGVPTPTPSSGVRPSVTPAATDWATVPGEQRNETFYIEHDERDTARRTTERRSGQRQ
jgi:peptidoglycan hydrolase-like protein with peptidoglycan-binding domain